MNSKIEIPFSVTDGISHWFAVRKGHRKARNIKAIKRRFLKKYGKSTEGFFDHICCNTRSWKWPAV
jgi:hypothetical protein